MSVEERTGLSHSIGKLSVATCIAEKEEEEKVSSDNQADRQRSV